MRSAKACGINGRSKKYIKNFGIKTSKEQILEI
jgi:hypothetical protein